MYLQPFNLQHGYSYLNSIILRGGVQVSETVDPGASMVTTPISPTKSDTK